MPRDSMFNILDKVYTGYKKLFPNGTVDQFETYVRRTFPNQVKYLNNFKTKLTDYAIGSIDDLKDTGNQVKQQVQQKATETKKAVQQQAKQVQQNIQRNVNTAKQTVNNVQQKAEARLNQALTANGLKQSASKAPSLASKAKNFVKTGAKVASKAGPAIAAIVDIPQTIGNWNTEGATPLTRGMDIAGNLLTVGGAIGMGTGVGLLPSAAAFGGGMALHSKADQMRNNASNGQYDPAWDTVENPLLKVTDEEKQKYFNYVNNEANQLQQQAQQGIQQSQEAIDFYNNVNNRMANEYNSALNEIVNTDMSLPAAPRTGLNFTSGTNTSPINLTPINEAPTSANNNQLIKTNQGNNQMVNQQPVNTQPTNNDMANLMNNIQMLNNYIGGVQRGNVLPNLGVSNEELQAYSNALRQYGENVSRARADVEAYRDALNRSNRMQAVANMADAIGNFVSTAVAPRQNMYYTNQYGQFVGVGAPDRARNTWGTGLRNASDRQLQNIQTNLELNNQLRQQEQAQATQFADLLTAARVSNATGLPLNIVRSMEPGDYLNYIKPVQEAQNRAQELGILGTTDLITGNQENLADYIKAIDVQNLSNQGSANVANINQTGGYNREQLTQYGANLRAQLEAMKDIRVAQLNNQTKLQLMNMTGMNAQQLEQLRQQDPNAYLRAVGNILMATSYSPGNPQARQVENILYNDVYDRIRPNAVGARQPAAESYWSQFNR